MSRKISLKHTRATQTNKKTTTLLLEDIISVLLLGYLLLFITVVVMQFSLAHLISEMLSS